MENIVFLVQGSAKNPYKVEFHKKGNNVTAKCDCKAGSLGQHCKHRINIIKGLKTKIVSDNSEQVDTIQQWLEGSLLLDSYKRLLAEVRVRGKGKRGKERFSFPFPLTFNLFPKLNRGLSDYCREFF